MQNVENDLNTTLCLQQNESNLSFNTNQTPEVQCKVQEAKTKKDRAIKTDFKCETCEKTFKYAKILQRHRLVHTSKNPYWCKLCMVSFATFQEKVAHQLEKHPRKARTPKCRLCMNISFKSEEEYLLHVVDVHKGVNRSFYMCSDCGKQFKTRNELTHHNNSKCGTIKQYKCKLCDQLLMTAGSLHNHMLRHKGDPRLMCGYCGKLYLTIGQLKVHERRHTQEKAFICDVCNKGFCHRQSLITHSTTHTGVKPFLCDNCGCSFSCVGNLIKHRRTHSDTCGAIPLTTHRVNNPSTKIKVKINTPKTSKLKSLEKEKELREKLDEYKRKLLRNDASQNTEIKTEPCRFNETEINSNENSSNNLNGTTEENCNLEIILTVSESSHLDEIIEATIKKYAFNETDENQNDNYVKSEKDFESDDNHFDDYGANDNHDYSDESNKMENTKGGVKKDFRIVDEKNGKKEAIVTQKDVLEFMKERRISEGAKAPCKFCKKTYTNIRCLIKHEQRHPFKSAKPIKFPYKCVCCKSTFPTREECNAHKKSTHANTLTCNDCEKIFSNLETLRLHCNSYHKGVPKKVYLYVCDKCGLQFRQKSALEQHVTYKCGTSGPLYECHICGKGFSSLHTTKTHLRIHDPKKKFQCKFCGKSFRWKGQLKIHERSHTGEKPFKCLYCPKAFAYRESLMTHSTVHTGFKPHLCRACGLRFSCLGNLIKHKVTHASSCGVWYTKNQ